MKNSHTFFLLVMVICVFLIGCNSVSIKATNSTATSREAGSTPNRPIIKTTSVTITARRTPVPTITSSSPTPTATILPTLTTDERVSLIKELFLTNTNCQLPCWWGITPGVSTWSEVEAFLKFIGARTGSQALNESSTYHGTGGFDVHSQEGVIANSIDFLEVDGNISAIAIHSEGYSNPVLFQEQWISFSPNHLIEEYGTPSRVWLESKSSGPVNEHRIAGYTLWIFYDHLGFAVLYTGYADYEPIYHFCPRFDNGEDIRFIQMFLQSPDNPRSIEETIMSLGIEIDQYPGIQSIDVAAGVNTTEFYDLFTQKNKPACLDTPRDIWP